MKIAFFDVDHTLVHGSTAMHCGRVLFRDGVINRSMMVGLAWAHLRHRLGILDFEEAYSRGIMTFVGTTADDLGSMMRECFDRHVRPNLYQEGINLVRERHDAGERVVLLSASSQYLLELFREVMPVDDIVAFHQHMRNNVLVGDFDRPIPYGPNKLALAREVASRFDTSLEECSFYTDNSADAPLLRAVGRPHAVNPNLRLYLEARLRRWPILKFRETHS